MAMPVSVMPRARVLVPRTPMVLWKRAWPLSSSTIARAGLREVGRAEGGDPLVDRAAQPGLDERRRLVRDHVPPVFERAAEQDGGGRERGGEEERHHRVARDHPREQPAEEREARDAHADRDEADHHRPRDAEPDTARESPELTIEIHGRPFYTLATRCLRSTVILS